jgi:serine/threonine protein kinase
VNRGKISQVWECVHRHSGDRYAAKIVYKRNLSPKDEDLVFQEVSMLTIVKNCCKNVTKFIDFYDEENRFYIVMEYADGGDLLSTLVYRQKLNETDAKKLAKSILEGLIQLHKENICHRNLKAENLLLKDQNDLSSVWIADFGMAARILYDSDGEPLKLTERCGTAMYMAPEVIAQIPYGCQIDVWSFGVLMYFALTGHFPYEDYNRQALYLKICKNDYSFDPSKWRGISILAKRFIANILHPDPEVRMTAAECLAHPWLEELKEVEPMAEAVELKLDESPSQNLGKKINTVEKRKTILCPWLRRRNEIRDDTDDSKSNATQTVSLLSSQVSQTNALRVV